MNPENGTTPSKTGHALAIPSGQFWLHGDRCFHPMSDPLYLLALDQGTTSSRAILFDRSGNTVATEQAEFRQSYPRPGWVEHDPAEIWSTQRDVAERVLRRAGVTSADVAAIGVTNQRETVVVWDAGTGEPIHPAIVWQDRRTADHCARLKRDGIEPMVTAKTGLRLDPYFSGTKLAWILDHVEGARARAEAGELLAGTIDTWLIWNLTGGAVHATDVTNASRTLLCDIRRGAWDAELLEVFNIPKGMLPEIRSCSEVYGEVSVEGALAGLRIAGVAGDQHAALFGQACFKKGMAKNTYGTGCFLLMNTGEDVVESHSNLLATVAWRIGDRTEYALEGSVFVAGAAVQWLRDELQLVKDVDELNELAASVPDAGGMYLVPAFAGLGAPQWDPYARGVTVGLTRGTNRAHFCRATLEAIALQIDDLIEGMAHDSGLALPELRVDGGATRSDLLLQIQADLLGVPVVRPRCVETTALGAANLAGLAVGYWESREAIAREAEVERTFKPQAKKGDMDVLRHGWRRAVERAGGWIEEKREDTDEGRRS